MSVQDPYVGRLHSADIVLAQATTDAHGLTQAVGYYPSVTSPTEMTQNGARLGFPLLGPDNQAEFVTLSAEATVRRLTGTGAAGVAMKVVGGPTVATGLSTGQTIYVHVNALAVETPAAGAIVDTYASLGTATTGRVSSSLLRAVLRLRDTIASITASREIFTPIGSDEENSTTISGSIHPGIEDPSWRVSIRDSDDEEVHLATGVGNEVVTTWAGLHFTTGEYVPDGVYTVNLTLDEYPNVLGQLLITIDSLGPVIPRLLIIPRDHGNTHYVSQPLLAKLTDAVSGVDASSIWFRLTDETDQQDLVETAIQASSYDPVTGWAKTDPVVLIENHTYTVAVDASDTLGNFASQSQRPVRDGGGFLAISAVPSQSSASIPGTACSVSEPDPLTQTRDVTCSSVPLALQDASISLSGAKRGSVGFVEHVTPLDGLGGAVLKSTVAGVPVSQPAFPDGTTHSSSLRFDVDAPSLTAQVPAVAGATVDLGPVTGEVPSSWEAVSIAMPARSTSPSLATCADPSGAADPVMCLPDPVWAIYQVIVLPTADPQAVANAHASLFGIDVEVFDTPEEEHGYWAVAPHDTAIDISSLPDVERVSNSDPSWDDDEVVHIEVRPPSGADNGYADLRCGWHDVCSEGNTAVGEGLDWGGFTETTPSQESNTRKSFFRAFGWAYEQDRHGGEIVTRTAPYDAGWIIVGHGPNPGCDEQMAQVIEYDDDPDNPGSRRYGAYYNHVEPSDQTPTDAVVLRAGQYPNYSMHSWYEPQYTKVRVGDEVTTASCGGADHTHFDLTASTNDIPQDHFIDTVRNKKVKTQQQCEAEYGSGSGTSGCDEEFDMKRPAKNPPGPDGGRMLALEARRYPVLWWDWVSNPCRADRVLWMLCNILAMP